MTSSTIAFARRSWSAFCGECMKEIATASTPSAARPSAAARTLASSSSTSTWPSGPTRSAIPWVRSRGASGCGGGRWLSYGVARVPSRRRSVSRKPSVSSAPVFEPLPVSTALVETVVPWTISSIWATNSSKGSSSRPAISSSPRTKASEGSWVVELVLWTRGEPPPRQRKSVKVPPTSMPSR